MRDFAKIRLFPNRPHSARAGSSAAERRSTAGSSGGDLSAAATADRKGGLKSLVPECFRAPRVIDDDDDDDDARWGPRRNR